MADQKAYWFLAKTHGWGWGWPVCWQGWLVMGLYLVGMLLLGLFMGPASHPLGFPLAVAALSGALLAVCWKTGEPPRWRWGRD